MEVAIRQPQKIACYSCIMYLEFLQNQWTKTTHPSFSPLLIGSVWKTLKLKLPILYSIPCVATFNFSFELGASLPSLIPLTPQKFKIVTLTFIFLLKHPCFSLKTYINSGRYYWNFINTNGQIAFFFPKKIVFSDFFFSLLEFYIPS